MILVTVGTWKFDELIAQVDQLAGTGALPSEVIGQIGCGTYVPKHFLEVHKIIPDLSAVIQRADLVISHGGMTTFEILHLGKRVISVCNPNVADNHQQYIVSELAKENHVIWCRNLDKLLACINSDTELRPYTNSAKELAEDIVRFLSNGGGAG